MLERQLAAPESTVVVSEEVVGCVHVERAWLLLRRTSVESRLDGVGEPMHLHLLEYLRRGRRRVNESAKHDGNAALAEVDSVNIVDRFVLGRFLKDIVRLADVVKELDVELHIGLGRNQFDGEQGHDAEGAQAAGGMFKQVGVVGAARGLESAVTQDNLDVGDGVVEQAIAVHAALGGEAGVSAADGDALELHDNFWDDAMLQAVCGECVHRDFGLGLDRHGLEIDGEYAIHVAGVDN